MPKHYLCNVEGLRAGGASSLASCAEGALRRDLPCSAGTGCGLCAARLPVDEKAGFRPRRS